MTLATPSVARQMASFQLTPDHGYVMLVAGFVGIQARALTQAAALLRTMRK